MNLVSQTIQPLTPQTSESEIILYARQHKKKKHEQRYRLDENQYILQQCYPPNNNKFFPKHIQNQPSQKYIPSKRQKNKENKKHRHEYCCERKKELIESHIEDEYKMSRMQKVPSQSNSTIQCCHYKLSQCKYITNYLAIIESEFQEMRRKNSILKERNKILSKQNKTFNDYFQVFQKRYQQNVADRDQRRQLNGFTNKEKNSYSCSKGPSQLIYSFNDKHSKVQNSKAKSKLNQHSLSKLKYRQYQNHHSSSKIRKFQMIKNKDSSNIKRQSDFDPFRQTTSRKKEGETFYTSRLQSVYSN